MSAQESKTTADRPNTPRMTAQPGPDCRTDIGIVLDVGRGRHTGDESSHKVKALYFLLIDCPTRLLGVSVTPIPTSHDSPGSCGWRFDTEDGSVGFLTDTGYVTDEALDLLPGVDLAIIEANHDVEALCSGPYPYSLKQRILGPEGHLSNEDAARLAVTLAEAGASELVLAHLSRDNNTPAMALNAVTAALEAAGLSLPVSVAPRECTGPCHTAHRRAVCKR